MQPKQKLTSIFLVLLLIIIGSHQNLWGSEFRSPHYRQPYLLDSRDYESQEAEIEVLSQMVVRIPNAPWLRVHFSDFNLGERSYITITSLEDYGSQVLDSKKLSQWRNSSAFFNGDAVLVELHAAGGEANIYFRIESVTVGEWVGESEFIESLCDGDDDRVASTDARVGRLFIGGCTAFLVSNGAVLTAGHCTDFDPDRCDPLLPDGVLDLAGVVEFNVPASRTDGTPVAAHPDDQYAIDTNNVDWNFDGSCQGLGKDWSVFAIFPNANNDDRAHITRGFFRMTRESPSTGNTIRITGYGIDDVPAGSTGGRNAQNVTEQTDTGPYRGESSSGGDFWHRYRADTEGANSGSPIIWNSQNIAIGIHTNGGCTSTGGENSGTSFEHNPLENALIDFIGANTIFADSGMPALATENGTIFRPYNTVTEAVTAVTSGGQISLVAGSYTRAAGNTFTAGADGKSMMFEAPVGTVYIGN
jgi:hypothetical protein